jgi:hypothetical protein
VRHGGYAREGGFRSGPKARAEIDAAALQAHAAVNGSDQKIAAAVKDYDAALGALRDKIDQKKRSGG